MDTAAHNREDHDPQRASFGNTVHEILQESTKRRVVIRNSSGKKVIEVSVLLALILSVGAPALPAFVILGVLVEVISVSIEEQ
jgi:hypothetical protein